MGYSVLTYFKLVTQQVGFLTIHWSNAKLANLIIGLVTLRIIYQYKCQNGNREKKRPGQNIHLYSISYVSVLLRRKWYPPPLLMMLMIS